MDDSSEGNEFTPDLMLQELKNQVPEKGKRDVDCGEGVKTSFRSSNPIELDQYTIYQKGKFPSTVFDQIQPINSDSKRNRVTFKNSKHQEELFTRIEDVLGLEQGSVQLIRTNQERPDIVIYSQSKPNPNSEIPVIGSINMIFKNRNNESVPPLESDRYLTIHLFNFKDMKKKADVKCTLLTFFKELETTSQESVSLSNEEKRIDAPLPTEGNNQGETIMGGRRRSKKGKKTQKKKKAVAKKRGAKSKRRIRRQ
jgi:hypothetical protein